MKGLFMVNESFQVFLLYSYIHVGLWKVNVLRASSMGSWEVVRSVGASQAGGAEEENQDTQDDPSILSPLSHGV